jgi:hypothetical protein
MVVPLTADVGVRNNSEIQRPRTLHPERLLVMALFRMRIDFTAIRIPAG